MHASERVRERRGGKNDDEKVQSTAFYAVIYMVYVEERMSRRRLTHINMIF